MSHKKGVRRERQARSIYKKAGYETEKSVGERYGRSDFFGKFDFMAVSPERVKFVQVKPKSASGIREMIEWAAENLPPYIDAEYAVYHDREGWRLIRAQPEEGSYTTLCDGRDHDKNMGVALAEFLNSEGEPQR